MICLFQRPWPAVAASLFTVAATPMKVEAFPADTVIYFDPPLPGRLASGRACQTIQTFCPDGELDATLRRLEVECGVKIHLNTLPKRSLLTPHKGNAHRAFKHTAPLQDWKAMRGK